MSLTPSDVTWDPNRYKATEYVISYDSNGVPTLSKKEADYTGTSYNFTALPTSNTTTTSGTTTSGTTTQTTQDQTSAAFGNVEPWWWKQQGEGDNNVFSGYQKEKEPVTELSGFFDPLGRATRGEPVGSLGMKVKQKFEDITGKTERDWEDVDRDIEIDKINAELAKGGLDHEEEAALRSELAALNKPSALKTATGLITRPIKKAYNWAKPFATQAIDYVMKNIRPGANKSFGGIAGLYTSEIELIKKYGSTRATILNPTGDRRKDDAGFNIVSFAGNYNKIGTNSRRHNMLKEADKKYKKNSKEWKDERDKIRNDFKIEKKTGIVNEKYNIDSSGSVPPGNGQGSTQNGPSSAPDRGESRGAGETGKISGGHHF